MTSQKASLEGKPSSFFMFCLNDFATKLSIPKAFVEKYRDFLLQKTMQLTTESGRSWEVEIKNINGDFFIVNGWSDFAKDNNLVEMMFLVFRIVASSTLHVTIFGHDSCFQLPPSPNPTDEGEKTSNHLHITKSKPSSSAAYTLNPSKTPPVESPNPSDQGGKTWRFVKELKKYNFKGQRMDLPVDFAGATGIGVNRHIELQDESGRKWPIAIANRSNPVSLITGWTDFLKGNNLQIGNILLFEYVPNSGEVMKVFVMKKKAGRELISQAKYGGFLKS